MDADAEFDPPFRRHADVALDEVLLHLDRTAHGVDDAAEFDDQSVAGALDDAAAMRGDGGIYEIATKPSEASKRSVFVIASKPAVSDDVSNQNRREFSAIAHRVPPGQSR